MNLSKIIVGFLLLLCYLCVLVCCSYVAYVSLIGTREIEEDISIFARQSHPKFSEILLFVAILIPVFCFLSCLIFAVNSLLIFCLYCIVMIMLLTLQALIFLFLHPTVENFKTAFENQVMGLIENGGDNFALQSLQEKYNCCGFDAFTDWLKKNKEIPGSCCKEKFPNTCPIDSVINVDGCRRIIYKNIEQTASYLPHVFSLIFILEVILFARTVLIVINFESAESKYQFPSLTHETRDHSSEGGIHFEEIVDTHG